MSCLQITACIPGRTRNNVSCYCFPPSLKGASVSYASRLTSVPRHLDANASVYKLRSPLCLFGGKGKPGNASEPLWGGLKKAMDSFKKGPSVEDMLKKQIQKQEYADDGDGGGMPPDNGDGSGGSGEDDFSEMFEEFIQVMLAVLAFIFLYIFIIDGEDIIQIAKDMIRYLFGARDSARLQRIMEDLGSFFISNEEEIEVPDNWLEALIINTPTWWDSPEKNRFILKHHPRPRKSNY
uniref:Uncharacterized protein n=1 Tax=Kalanchoe fedtschenkoi TaxID=63787 RepID=A0A7N0U1P9_KALFE